MPKQPTPRKRTDAKWVLVPVPVTLLIPMPATLAVDQDHLKEDAVELVKRGKLKLDGIKIKHRLKRP